MKYFYECNDHGVFGDDDEVRQHRPCPVCNGRCWMIGGEGAKELATVEEGKKSRRKKINARTEGE